MTDILEKSCKENENPHFMFNNFFSENRTVNETMSKNLVETEGPQMTSQHGAYALRAGLAKLHVRMRMHTSTCPGTHIHARTHMQACTQRKICNNYNFSTPKMVSRTRLGFTLHIHCLSRLNMLYLALSLECNCRKIQINSALINVQFSYVLVPEAVSLG